MVDELAVQDELFFKPIAYKATSLALNVFRHSLIALDVVRRIGIGAADLNHVADRTFDRPSLP
jgi:hypothetical protein